MADVGDWDSPGPCVCEEEDVLTPPLAPPAPATGALDYTAQARSRVLLQYRQSPKLLAELDLLMAHAQELENTLVALEALDDYTTAEGVNLEVTGELVGQGRELINGSIVTDVQLRMLIGAKISRNHSRSTGPDLLSILSQIFGGAPILLTDYGAMSIHVGIGVIPTADEIAVLDGDILARPMGVQMTRSYYNPSAHFGYSDDPGALGYTDTTIPVVGGPYAEGF